jgi:hypothetical protein
MSTLMDAATRIQRRLPEGAPRRGLAGTAGLRQSSSAVAARVLKNIVSSTLLRGQEGATTNKESRFRKRERR